MIEILLLYLGICFAYFVVLLKNGRAFTLEDRWYDYIFAPGVFLLAFIFGGSYLLYLKIRELIWKL